MFKIFGLASAVLVFVAVRMFTADNLLASLIGLCFLALESWHRLSKAGFAKPHQADTVSRLEQGTSSVPDYKATPIYRKLLTACLGDNAAVERLIDYEIRQDPQLSRSAATAAAFNRLCMDRR